MVEPRLTINVPVTVETDGPAETAVKGEPVVRFEDSKEKVALYLPPSLALHDGHFDLVVHFHGPRERSMAALDRAELGAVMINVNLGDGGVIYENAASANDYLDRLVAFAETCVEESGRTHGAHVGRIALSSWSAGFGAVRQIMRRPSDAARIDGLLLADGLFTDWNAAPAGRPQARDANLEKVAPVVDFARRATTGEKLFVLTHTSIDRRFYADAPDIADAMIRQFKVEKGFPDLPSRSAGPSPVYASDVGSFHVWSFGGKAWADHLAQHDAMRKQYSALKAFWHEG